MAAVTQTMAGVTGATMTAESLDKQNAIIDSTDAQKLQGAITSIENSLTTSLAPALSKFADTIQAHQGDIDAFVRGVGEAAEFFLGHPFAGIGAVVLGGIVKDIAAAQIGASVASAIAAAVGGSGGVGGALGRAVGEGAGPAAGVGAGAVLGAGVVGGAVGVAAGIAIVNHETGKLARDQGAHCRRHGQKRRRGGRIRAQGS